MKKGHLLGILFFSALWGFSEVLLGGALYRAHLPYASVPLTIIGFSILTVANIYLPGKGSLTIIGAIAMLYKFLNAPFFVCHLLAIFLLALSYDLIFNFLKLKNRSFSALLATYLGYALFAFTITYVFRYPYWAEEGLPRILRYIGISGTGAALANLILVPFSFRLGIITKDRLINPFELGSKLVTASAAAATISLWIVGLII